MYHPVRAIFFAALLSALISLQAFGQMPVPRSLDDLVKWVNQHNKAPFDRNSAQLPPGGAAALMRTLSRTQPAANVAAVSGHNVKVNQDRNPWPKAELAAAVDPVNGNDWVVMENDFRENWDHMFFHVSTNGGLKWTDDSMVGGNDPFTGFIPLTFQSDPGVALDSKGRGMLSTITGNSIVDFTNQYQNFDSEIETTVSFNHGTYASLLPINVDDQPCNGTFSVFNCPIQLDKPLITIDNVPGSPNNGAVYVYYTVFCVQENPCTDGNANVPGFSSAIVESHAAGVGLPFSTPELVSGHLAQEQFSDMVIDSHGTPHIFFDDFTKPVLRMFESTLMGGRWVVDSTPVAVFNFTGLGSINWGFRSDGTIAPGCGIHQDTAYCAFSANQIVGRPAESSVSAYVAVVNTRTGTSQIHRVNNDPFNAGKDHFFPWATAKPDGSVYVGWYDDRNDPFDTKVQYFVGKSTDGGKTFPTQMPVSDVAFNPCIGFPGCGFFGDYTQLVSGPDGVVRAAWSDTRDGVSMQVYSQAVTW
jgi:hypothetical protein